MVKKEILCPECQNPLFIPDESRIGDVLECEQCGSEVRIVSEDAVELIEEEK